MAKCKEDDIIKACEDKFESEASEAGNKEFASGLMMELYEFITDINDSTNQTPEVGRLIRPTSMDQLNFICGLLNRNGHIQMKDKRRKRVVDAKFWIKERAVLTQMTQMVDRGLILKHDGILKALACADSDQLSKVIIACENFDLPLQEWLNQNGATAIPNGDYLSDEGKDIVRSGWNAIEYIWSMGYTCDDLDKVSTYVMAGRTLKILPFFIRRQVLTDSKLMLRERFADLLDNYIAPLWVDREFSELTLLMRSPDASFELILGHPVLASPEERLLMYRISYYPYMTKDQLDALLNNIPVDANWTHQAGLLDLAFNDILQGGFSSDVLGQLKFAVIVSCHYAQRRKRAEPTWNGQLVPNYVDMQLKRAVPLLLCKRYALKVHAAFSAKVAFQL